MFSRFKYYGKSALEWSGVFPFLKGIKRRFSMREVDPRRFWNGETITAPKGNAVLFPADEAVTVTYQKESRDAIEIPSGKEFLFEILEKKSTCVRLSVGYDGIPEFFQGVTVFLGKKKVAELLYIIPGRWHHMNFKVSKGEVCRVVNTTPSEIFLAHPIIEQKSSQDRDSRHPKNIIVLILDSLTRDALGSFDAEAAPWTPHITRFFKKALKYRNAITQAEWTLPSIYSTLTSRYPLDHDMIDLKFSIPNMISGTGATLAEQMRFLGYTTLAYSTAKIFHPGFHAHTGFDRFFYDVFPQPHQTHHAITETAIAHLEYHREGKNFLFLHYLDTHEPWLHPSEFESVYLPNFRITDPMKEYDYCRKGYGDTKAESIFDDEGQKRLTKRKNARLRDIDATLRTLFDYLETSGALRDSVVVLCSDHGFLYLGGHKPLLCDTRVNVPFLMYHPAFENKIYDDLIALNLDLAPTLIQIAGGEFQKGSGQVMPPFGRGHREYVLSESIFGNWYKGAVRDQKYVYHYCCEFRNKKVIVNRVRSRFLFERAREEAGVDLVQKNPEILQRMHRTLLDHFDKFPNKVSYE